MTPDGDPGDRRLTGLDAARAADRSGRVVEASQLYEAAIEDGTADLDAHLDLAILYACALDGGFAAYHRLDVEFVNFAVGRVDELFDAARERFKVTLEVDGWWLFAHCAFFGDVPEKAVVAHAETIAGLGSRSAYVELWIHHRDGDDTHRGGALRIRDELLARGTQRSRAVMGHTQFAELE